MTELHLKPAPGLMVRDPDSYEPLAAKGEKKPRTGFWLRRLKDGDVVTVTAAAETVAPKKGADK
ncbi:MULTISPECIES: DUF2635 domain-containing protein [Yersinia]|uniref:DUF2635 domain-containing protein n=1 Tax=Yersinia TaxID=629 RepID=UPI000C15DA2C|nr:MULTISPECIES: DUF2635 domain-containing protein [Yersinia]EKN3738792.1 DUF2635 domain-containing protein [Yersinia enterocolitica]MDA5523316.1 DUF2635 domain-containing protein [Yersinia kristensenii]MDA5544590.1 DUF2635 domain-containing protein [Yersinia rochesterensis]PHZ36587.1 DUF2635 domain-containing protein [Yersinia kristensenii]UZM75991.1 DUF2635 domain-containing protein [Yersinia sp. SCPM-O-B-9106 (C-191)]